MGKYTVRAGDTLSAIAARFKTTWQRLAKDNHLSNPNKIYPGQQLTVPGTSAPKPAPKPATGTYVVRSGDTLSAIAARFKTTWQWLARENSLANPNRIYPGQRIKVPNTTATKPTPPKPPTTSAKATAAINKANATTHWRSGMCDNFVAGMYGYGASGYATAKVHWDSTPANHRSTSANPPAGALVFWAGGSKGYGHAALSLGGGKVRTIDMDASGRYVPGVVSTVPIGWIAARWGQHYLGWTDVIIGGKLVVDL